VNCWKCKKSLGETPAKIGFKATCPYCDIDLHCCKNCRYFSPGKPNDCMVPGTEYVRDREAANFCEEFKVKISSDPNPNEKETLKTRFDSLFKMDKVQS